MKRLLWYFKAGFLCMALFVIFGGYASSVVAQDPLDPIGAGAFKCIAGACAQSTTNTCFCEKKNGSCTGCFVNNGGTGCGTCVSE
jgi:hypothetical protein